MKRTAVNIVRLSVSCLVLLLFAGFMSWQLHAAGAMRDKIPPATLNYLTPNNGHLGTTFLLHIQPYWIFAEDYHLYYLRAKRVAAFGPVDDILEPSRSQRYDLRNASQLAISLLPALYGEDIQSYAMIYFLYITVSLLLIYWATRTVVRQEFLALCATILAVMLVDGTRFYRISTTMFSLPLLLLVLARLMRSSPDSGASAQCRPHMVLGTALLALAALDVWTYLFGVSILCFHSLGGIARRKTDNIVPLFFASLPSLLYLGATVAIYSGRDLSMRAGMGLSDVAFSDIFLLFKNPAFLSLLGMIVLLLLSDRRSAAAWMMISVMLGYASVIIGFGLVLGIDTYQLEHFKLFLKPVAAWLAVVALAVVDWDGVIQRNAVTASALRLFDNKALRWRDAAASLLFLGVALVLVYTDIISSRFLGSIQAGTVHFANPARHERLLAYLQGYVRDQRGKSFLTLSPELNYYIAFHSGFDMLLPSGFPLHSRRSNEEIALRMAGISLLLGIQPSTWEAVLQPGQDHDVWIKDRVQAAKRNYLYDLYHRYGSYDGGRTRMLEILLREAAAPTQEPLAPDYILVDEVAASLHAQVPGWYRLIYDDHDIRLYQKSLYVPRAVAPVREEVRATGTRSQQRGGGWGA